ncbi:unnamed protein product [Cercopithifilaria johnstoni]|uniref:Uncharacterized protein n=1 Tax=Cercopithifilaria johnstoni TaxID=2874296 RepID=A0A8J2Q6W1_9BILA|nr:unnamed protein product [Cercopithifilaria johnstoni]
MTTVENNKVGGMMKCETCNSASLCRVFVEPVPLVKLTSGGSCFLGPVLCVCVCVAVSVCGSNSKNCKNWTMAPPASRKQSIVEVVERTFDKNTLILIVNLLILVVLTSLLYMVATSAMASSRRDEH